MPQLVRRSTRKAVWVQDDLPGSYPFEFSSGSAAKWLQLRSSLEPRTAHDLITRRVGSLGRAKSEEKPGTDTVLLFEELRQERDSLNSFARFFQDTLSEQDRQLSVGTTPEPRRWRRCIRDADSLTDFAKRTAETKSLYSLRPVKSNKVPT